MEEGRGWEGEETREEGMKEREKKGEVWGGMERRGDTTGFRWMWRGWPNWLLRDWVQAQDREGVQVWGVV
jgi:hypothetical protein